ncbi:hypothetical protein MTP04_19670 [Lysinibacillus sp. PLM2]|nr:hypothetical protein MTP04_19670 [Lysinibacillus sp. PLM2]
MQKNKKLDLKRKEALTILKQWEDQLDKEKVIEVQNTKVKRYKRDNYGQK